jgi:putative tryptophan/tyrosine transport system substrate-binding protein
MRLTRRHFVEGAGALGFGLLAGCGRWPGQTPAARVYRIGWLTGRPPTGSSPDASQSRNPNLAALRHGLRDLGYVEGQHYIVEARSAGEHEGQLPELAGELTRLPIDIIVSGGPQVTNAWRQATTTIPIVMVAGARGDPVGEGLIASYARPGGNITGFMAGTEGMAGKRLELLKDTVPGIARVGVLWESAIEPLAQSSQARQVMSAAELLGLETYPLEVSAPNELQDVFQEAIREHLQGLWVGGSPLFVTHAPQVAALAMQHRLPTVGQWRVLAEAGGLMAYGAPSLPDLFRRAATYVDKIWKGASPAELPVERPMRFDFVINFKTAQALGLTIPQHVLLQATEIIQ